MLIPADAQLAALVADLSRYAPVRPFAQLLATSSYACCPDGYDPARFAWGMTAVGAQESGFGHLLTPPGPLGAGDFTARTGAWLKHPEAQVCTDQLPRGWVSSRPGPWAIPADGQGWGRWLYQFDWGDRVHGAFVRANPQATPQQQTEHFAQSWAALLEEFGLVEANAAEAWNAGDTRVSAELAAGLDPDDVTTQHYGARFSAFMRAWAPGGAQ